MTTATDFYVVFASDPQYPWGSTAWADNVHHLASINQLVDRIGPEKVMGVVMNGDMVQYGHPGQVETFLKIYEGLAVPRYVGLGNHDYGDDSINGNPGGGPVNNCHENRCANRMVNFMRDELRRMHAAGLINSGYDFDQEGHYHYGSLAYSWDHQGVHFVQLQNYPTYSVRWDGSGFHYSIRSSLDWLRKDLEKAHAEGKKLIVNQHRYAPSWAANRSTVRFETPAKLPVQAQDGGHGPVTASRQGAEAHSLFELEKSQRRFGLKASNGKYVRVELGGNAELVADEPRLETESILTFEELGGDKIALRSHYGFYLCEDQGEIVANRSARGTWETFQRHEGPNGTFSLEANNGKFVTVVEGGRLCAIAESAGPNERFEPVERGRQVALRSHKGLYLRAEEGGGKGRRLRADRDRRGEHETFNLTPIDDGRFLLSSTHGNLVRVAGGGPGALMVDGGRGTNGFEAAFRMEELSEGAIFSGFPISAFLQGHHHSHVGWVHSHYGAPVFRCGAADTHLYLLIHFQDTLMTVESYSSRDGKVTKLDSKDYPYRS